MLLVAPRALADPQAHVAVRTAVCGAGEAGRVWSETRWCNGLTADLLFLRERNRDVGVGPYVEILSAGFWDARFGGGVTLLAPVTDSYPLTLSVGLYDHALERLALGGTLFWGLRSYNFDNAYNYSLGLYASAQRDLDHDGASLVSVGLEIDGFFFAAPVLLAVGALR